MSYRIQRPQIIVLALVTVVVSVGLANRSSAEFKKAPVVESTQDPNAVAKSFLDIPVEKLSPRLLEIRGLLASQQDQLLKLTAQYKAATTDQEALRVQREIHDLKRNTEASMIRVQLRFARLEGNEEGVSQLEEMLNRIESKPGILPPTERPPVAENK